MKDLTAKTLVDRVEAKIRALLWEGVPLTVDVAQFIEATLGSAVPDAVADLLSGPDESERETLLELVFFPDLSSQYAVEEILAGGGLSPEDRSRLARRLKTDLAGARIKFPGHARQLDCRLPDQGVDAFLTRLNLAWAMDAHLRPVLEQWADKFAGEADVDAVRLIVQLRNADLQQTPAQLGLLKDFLERMPPTDRRWRACFDFLMAFLPAHDHVLDFYRALMDRKMFLVHHLMKARRNAATISRSNMETLSMSGFRASHFDTAAAEEALACIDAVALAVYGHTAHVDDAPVSLDLGQAGDAADIEGIFRRLL